MSTIPKTDVYANHPYAHQHHRSLIVPNEFWAEQAARIPWVSPPTQILSTGGDGPDAIHRWFADRVLNTCYAALDYHAKGRPRRPSGFHPRLTHDEYNRWFYRAERRADWSGKILRKNIQQIADGETFSTPQRLVPRPS